MGFFKKLKEKVTEAVKETVTDTAVEAAKEKAEDILPALITVGASAIAASVILRGKTPAKRSMQTVLIFTKDDTARNIFTILEDVSRNAG